MYKLSTQKDEQMSYAPGIPDALARYRIPRTSNSFHQSGESITQLFQQIEGRQFDVWNMHFTANRPATLYSQAAKPVLSLHFAMNNLFNYTLGGIGAIRLPQRRFNLTFAPRLEGHFQLAAGQHYWYFEVHPSLALLEELADGFPPLERFLGYVSKDKPAMLAREHPLATAEMLNVIHNILYNPFERGLRDIYLETKALELLLLALHRSLQDNMLFRPVMLTGYDKGKLQEARAYLLEHIDDRTSIADLSRMIGINRNKLTGGFRQLYGSTIFEFLINKRMERARQLLLDTALPIQEIAMMIGYSKLSNFTTAFTRKFGIPPSIFRQRR